MRPILALALALSLAACSSEPKPGQREFDAASSQIASESSGKAFSGNTEAARARAELVSIAVTSLDRQLFAGQDEHQVARPGAGVALDQGRIDDPERNQPVDRLQHVDRVTAGDRDARFAADAGAAFKDAPDHLAR